MRMAVNKIVFIICLLSTNLGYRKYVYINQLSELQRLLIKEERYEEAGKIGKIIKDEEIKLGIRK